ncbi:hypothetical protein BDF19DRAFT_430016 [Syncephalis fuscata]|nr:hypothetical protein BDF19DRAFT_430016 [Syncephalis fuscata]
MIYFTFILYYVLFYCTLSSSDRLKEGFWRGAIMQAFLTSSSRLLPLWRSSLFSRPIVAYCRGIHSHGSLSRGQLTCLRSLSPLPRTASLPRRVSSIALQQQERTYVSLPVDTYQLVKQLESRGFTRKQAEVIMKAMCGLLTHSENETHRQLLDKDDLENETYLFRAALDELRMEIEVLRRTDQATLKAESDLIAREIDVLTQRLRETIATLRQENQAIMNGRRLDQRSDEKEMDMRIHELNDLLMVKLGEVRTEIETMKMAATRNAMVMVFWAGSICMFIGYLLKKKRQTIQAAADAEVNKGTLSSIEGINNSDEIEQGVLAHRPPYEPVTRTSPFAP